MRRKDGGYPPSGGLEGGKTRCIREHEDMVAFQGGHPPFKDDYPYLRPQPSWAESSPTRSKALPCGALLGPLASLSRVDACNPLLQAHPTWARDKHEGRGIPTSLTPVSGRLAPPPFVLALALDPSGLGHATTLTRRPKGPPGLGTPTLLLHRSTPNKTHIKSTQRFSRKPQEKEKGENKNTRLQKFQQGDKLRFEVEECSYD
jgi:hypothetical protein